MIKPSRFTSVPSTPSTRWFVGIAFAAIGIGALVIFGFSVPGYIALLN
ncbi:MAG TPA: hypothetical protein VM910_03980 [Bradyrhizobium sp.]|jgi:hypothetical protein|nr:hypothetical protein [Bradyrhizobium sp.]